MPSKGWGGKVAKTVLTDEGVQASASDANSRKLQERALARVFRGLSPAGDSKAKRHRAQQETAATDAEQPAKALKLTTDPDGGSDSDAAARAEVEELKCPTLAPPCVGCFASESVTI